MCEYIYCLYGALNQMLYRIIIFHRSKSFSLLLGCVWILLCSRMMAVVLIKEANQCGLYFAGDQYGIFVSKSTYDLLPDGSATRSCL